MRVRIFEAIPTLTPLQREVGPLMLRGGQVVNQPDNQDDECLRQYIARWPIWVLLHVHMT